MKTYRLACAAVAALMAASGAEAATTLKTIEQSWNVADAATAPLRMFDGALGKLEKVEVSYTISGTGTAIVTNRFNYPVGAGLDVSYRFFAPSTPASGTGVLGISAGCFIAMVAPLSTLTQGCSYSQSVSAGVAPNTTDFVGKAGDVFTWTTAGNATSIAKETAALKLVYFYSLVAAVPPVATAVPEPATWALMAGGFAMVGMTARRRRRRAGVIA